MKVFLQFAGPTIITLRYFPFPLRSNSRTALAKNSLDTPFLCRISSAQLTQSPLQPSTHALFLAPIKRSMGLCFDLSSVSCAFSISQAVVIISATARGVLLTRIPLDLFSLPSFVQQLKLELLVGFLFFLL